MPPSTGQQNHAGRTDKQETIHYWDWSGLINVLSNGNHMHNKATQVNEGAAKEEDTSDRDTAAQGLLITKEDKKEMRRRRMRLHSPPYLPPALYP